MPQTRLESRKNGVSPRFPLKCCVDETLFLHSFTAPAHDKPWIQREGGLGDDKSERGEKKNKANKQTTKNRKGDEGETIAWTEEIFIKHKKKIDARKLTFFLFQLFTKPNKRRMMKWQKKIIIRLGWRQTVKKWRKKKEIENNGSLSGSLKSKV